MINVKLPVLEKDHVWSVHSEKLDEESAELMVAIQCLVNIQKCGAENIEEDAAADVLAETFDVIQICVGVLDKLMNEYPTVKDKGILEHVEKLYSR